MFNFSEFLAEKATVKKPAQKTVNKKASTKVVDEIDGTSLNDDKGKLAELHLAHHLGKHLVGEGERYYPSHFRGEEKLEKDGKISGGTPQQVEKRIIGRRGKDLYGAVDRHSAQSAEALIDHLIKTGKIRSRQDIHGVHWTSNADTFDKEGNPRMGDHGRLTGVHDPNQKADIMLSVTHPNGEKGYVPVSAKYGSENKPNYANWGLDRLSRETATPDHESGMNRLDYMKAQQMAELEKKMGHVYGSGAGATSGAASHKLFKVDRDLRKKKEKEDIAIRKGEDIKPTRWTPKQLQQIKNADTAYGISVANRRKMAKVMADSLNNKAAADGNDSHMRGFITKSVSDTTHLPTVIVHSKTKSSDPYGDVESRVYDQDDVAKHVLKKYDNIHARVGGDEDEEGGISLHFYGTNKRTGGLENVATQSLKATSGPFKGINGTFRIQHADSESKDPTVNAPAHRVVKDKETGEQSVVEPTVPDNATIWGPKKMLSQYRTTMPPEQRRVAQTGSPFQAMAKPGVKRPQPSTRVAPNGYPEHMHQAHKDTSHMGYQDSGQ